MEKESKPGAPAGAHSSGQANIGWALWPHLRAVLVRCCLGLLAATMAYADNRVAITGDYEHYALDSYASYLLDPDGHMSLERVRKSEDWSENAAGSVLNFGFTGTTLWIKVPLRLPPGENQSWSLVIPYPLLEQVELFGYDTQSGEQLFNYSQTDLKAVAGSVPAHFINFALPEHLSGAVDLVLKARSSTSLQVPLELWSRNYLVSRQVMETLAWGIYFGVIIALIAYNSFLFSSVRDWAYGYYVLYLVAVGGLMLCISGMGAVYVWAGEPSFNRHALPIFTGLASMFALFFARSFLHWRGFPARLDRVMAAVALVAASLVVYAGFNPIHGAQLSGWVSSLAIALVIVAGLNALLSGVVIARYFVMAWMVFAIGASLYLLNVFGLIPVSRLSNHSIQAGSALEAVLLSFALAHRIKEDRQQKLLALQQQHRAEQQMKQLQLQALDQAMHDPVTKMPNESLLTTRLQELIRSENSAYQSFALVLLHFPQMKEIASSLGRSLADALFRSIIRDLNQSLSSNPQAICIEPDNHAYVAVAEFGTLAVVGSIGDLYDPINQFAERLMSAYDAAVDIGSIAVNLDAFCGIALYPKHGERADVLLQHANAARDAGLRASERLSMYSAEIDAYGRRRLALMGSLSRAIKDSELELYLQPQLDCYGLQLTGAEILLRWNSPKHGAVPTQEFIDIAESAGLMNHLTRYVVSRSLSLLRLLHQNGLRLTLSINLSVQNLIEPDFVNFMIETAKSYEIDLSDIVLEVTETSMIENISTVIDNLHKLAKTGCSIALDDFGTGYSSLAYLSRLPIHELKIDRSFIRQMGNSNSDFRIVENTVKLARTLQMQTVAEGVEDNATLDQVTQLGCTRVQGYLLGKPMPLGQFHEWALRKAS